ncbi:MAG: hypothetical protein R3C11_04215 [Planctomycetaceae bacterium]
MSRFKWDHPESEDDLFKQGKVALLADGPALFQNIQVTTSTAEQLRIKETIQARLAEEQQLQERTGHRIEEMNLDDFGVGISGLVIQSGWSD